ncbi:hypothetical protein Droror1_Dr00003196 [Drosera rotundifolia]
MANNDAHIPHVLLFPNPQPGHINPFLDLAELLCLTGLHYVTFVTTTQIRHRLIHHSNVISRFSGYPGFRLVGISDGLGPEDPLRNVKNVIETYRTMYTIVKDGMRRMLASGELGGGVGGDRPPVSCFIDDGCVEFLVDVAEEFRIPFVAFHTSSAAITWFTFCVPELVRAGKMPFVGDDDDKIYAIEGLEDLLRIKDIQSLTGEVWELFVSALIRHQQAKMIIFNTFEDLEAPFLSYIRTKCPRAYAIGPLHTHLASRTSSNSSDHSSQASSLGILPQDRSCLTWLDAQPTKSVIYISFGSQAVLKSEELLELWHGIIDSGKKFLWVMRERLEEGNQLINQKHLIEKVLAEGRGYIVPLAPQKQVLAHPAIGSFLTHCGWNSTLECLVSSVPMICWPHGGDQPLNGRYVSEVLKLGVYLKDYECERGVIARVVSEVMEQRKDELCAAAALMAAACRGAVSEGGSSYKDFNRLVDFICSLAPQS